MMKARWHQIACSAFATLIACAELSHAEVPRPVKPFVIAAPTFVISDVPGWSPDQTPADFLDGIGSQLKARWRQLYREAPPPPSTMRPLSAFTLGGLLADSFLALQASDAQQFRNNNQDVLTYCRVLGLNEKLAPRFMSQGKLAEEDKWSDLRQAVVDGHQELCRVLHEQRDEDLAVLVDLGIWMRLLEMISGVVQDTNAPEAWPLTIGSPALLRDLKARFDRLSEITRAHEKIVVVGEAIDFLCRHWDNTIPPDATRVANSHRKLELIMRKLTLK